MSGPPWRVAPTTVTGACGRTLSERRPAFQGLRLFRFSVVRVLIGGQAHPVEAQTGHGDYLPAVVTASNALRKTADLEEQVCAAPWAYTETHRFLFAYNSYDIIALIEEVYSGKTTRR